MPQLVQNWMLTRASPDIPGTFNSKSSEGSRGADECDSPENSSSSSSTDERVATSETVVAAMEASANRQRNPLLFIKNDE
mmetsp:Transcript_33419/g.68367  ORF Transcript_33419/g.68367 Transcript_33419/m.68367 type:complete len:80 (+) Transcript_33419:887-1126(+)